MTTKPSNIETTRNIFSELREILKEFWDYRELLSQLTMRDIRIRYKQAVMGYAWAILVPMLIVGAGIMVRVAVAYLQGSELAISDATGIAVKSMPWAFFVGAIGFATPSLITNYSLVTKVYFPKEMLPISAVLAQCFDSFIGTATLIVFLFIVGINVSVNILWLPLLIIPLILLTSALALFFSCGSLFFRDVKYIVQVTLNFGIFFTPVFFEPAMFGPLGAKLMMLNPLAPILEGIRLSVIEGHNLLIPLTHELNTGGSFIVWSPMYLIYSTAWALFGFFASVLLFHRLEFVFAEFV